MRTIKFRGQDKSGEWHTGCLVISLGICYIYEPLFEKYRGEYVITDRFEKYEVHSKSIGQFTGLLDKNGKEIYEGDIVKASWGYSGEVDFDNFIYAQLECTISDDIEVVGNIHDTERLCK